MNRLRIVVALSVVTLYHVPRAPAESLAQLLMQDGWAAYQRGALETAQEQLTEAVAEARASRDQADLSAGLAKLAWIHFKSGHPAKARTLAAEAIQFNIPSTNTGLAELVLAETANTLPEIMRHFENAEKLLGPGDNEPVMAEVYLHLANLVLQSSDAERASTLAEKARKGLSRARDPSNYFRAIVISAKASLAKHNVAECERWYAQAEDIKSAESTRLNLTHVDWAEYLCGYSDFRLTKGDLQGSFALLDHARTESERVMKGNDPALAPIVAKQANILVAQGRLYEALRFADWVVKYSRQERVVADGLVIRANVHFAAGRFSQAMNDFVSSQKLYNRILGEAHPTTCSARISILKAQLCAGHTQGVEAQLRELLESVAQQRSGGALEARTLSLVAQHKLVDHKFAAAQSIAKRAVERFDQTLTCNQSELLEAGHVLAMSYLWLGDLEAARQSMDESLRVRAAMPSVSDLWDARAAVILGWIDIAAKNNVAAQRQFQRALEIWNRPAQVGGAQAPRPECWHLDRANVHLGLLSIALADQAEQDIKHQWQQAQTIMALTLPGIQVARRTATIGDLHTQWDREFHAIWFYQKAADIVREVDGPLHPLIAQMDTKLKTLHRKHAPVTAEIAELQVEPQPPTGTTSSIMQQRVTPPRYEKPVYRPGNYMFRAFRNRR